MPQTTFNQTHLRLRLLVVLACLFFGSVLAFNHLFAVIEAARTHKAQQEKPTLTILPAIVARNYIKPTNQPTINPPTNNNATKRNRTKTVEIAPIWPVSFFSVFKGFHGIGKIP